METQEAHETDNAFVATLRGIAEFDGVLQIWMRHEILRAAEQIEGASARVGRVAANSEGETPGVGYQLERKDSRFMCCHCGDVFVYLPRSTAVDKLQAKINHVGQCKRNPLVREIARLRRWLRESGKERERLAEEGVRLRKELFEVDGVLGNRSVLDGIPDRAGKIKFAIDAAKEKNPFLHAPPSDESIHVYLCRAAGLLVESALTEDGVDGERALKLLHELEAAGLYEIPGKDAPVQ